MTLASTVAPLAIYAVVFQTVLYLALPSRLRTAVAPVVTGLVGAGLTLAAAFIFGFDTIGLVPTNPGASALWTFAAVAGSAFVGAVMLSRADLREQLADPRLADLSPRQAWMQIGFRIPVFTALFEEAFFRGVLHAALVALFPTPAAIWLGAGLFGLWHVGPGIDQAQATDKSRPAGALHTIGTVIATTVVGAFLVWLRVETGSIWAGVGVHAGINMTMAIFARLAGRSNRRQATA